ncbi:FadR family transcriptional regulator [Noviherbaspirillum sp. 17J57-3]|uniref:FadR family transcriptional regulator n=2 Tax=Noviherbaspirillum galbum TaxID=2709383 RepID=A0A6B3SN05_9BURK|nr:FadR family transcriptional regulator [Noviherbaspirillum galbum]
MDNAAVLKEAILAKLNAGEWRPGHRIATERALSESFGIGRSAVRRVLAELKQAGIITQTVGSGTFVSDSFTPSPAAAGGSNVSPYELMEARLAIEIAIVEMIIRNASQSDFAQMALCCDKAEAATSMEEFERWDGQLHECMARAAHNALVDQVFALIKQGRAQDDWGALKRDSLTPERRQAYQVEHRQIVNALRDRDLARATEATRAHLLRVRHNLLGI